MEKSKKVSIRRRTAAPTLGPSARVIATMQDLRARGILNHPKFQIREPDGPNAERAKAWVGYADARLSAQEALLQLASQTKDFQCGLGKSGIVFRYDLGKHMVRSGFIDETKTASANGMPFPVTPNAIDEVVKLGSQVKGKGTLREIREALHNFEKLDDIPRLLRDLNPVRLPIVAFWMDQHLWLMTDETIADWFNRKVRPTDPRLSGGIMRAAVSRAVRELGLKKSPLLVVKEINCQNQVVFCSPVTS